MKHKFVLGNKSLRYLNVIFCKFCWEGSFALKVVCEIVWFYGVQFFEYSSYRELTVFMNFCIFSSVTSVKNIWRVDFCSSLFESTVVKIEAFSKKELYLSHQRNKVWELKFIQCPTKVSFQGQRNPRNCKNPSKITSFKSWDF